MTVAQVEAWTSSRLLMGASPRSMKGSSFVMDEIRRGVSGRTRDDARVLKMDGGISGDDPSDRKIDAPDASP